MIKNSSTFGSILFLHAENIIYYSRFWNIVFVTCNRDLLYKNVKRCDFNIHYWKGIIFNISVNRFDSHLILAPCFILVVPSAGRLGNTALSYGLPLGAGAAYAQPVIYIHPESLSTGYPLQALGLTGITGYPAVASSPYTTAALESLYSPYGTSNSQARSSKFVLFFIVLFVISLMRISRLIQTFLTHKP